MSPNEPPPLPQAPNKAVKPPEQGAEQDAAQFTNQELKASYMRHLPQAVAALTVQKKVLEFMKALIDRKVPDAIEHILTNWPQIADPAKKKLWQEALLEAVKEYVNPVQDPERAADILVAMYAKWRKQDQNPETFFNELLEKMRRNSWKTIRRTAIVRMAVHDMISPRKKKCGD